VKTLVDQHSTTTDPPKKTVDFVEVFLCAAYHSINVRFDDKTSLSFVVEPGFTLDPNTPTGRPATGVPSRNGR
jgi:hypothetical protein